MSHISAPERHAAITTIDHLDFDPDCDIYNPATDHKCDQPANWWCIAKHHCRDDHTFQVTVCESHHDYIINGGRVRCGTCLKPHSPHGRIIRWERIR